MTGYSQKKKIIIKIFKVFRVKNKFMKETKDFYLNPLNMIKWGPDERSASDFALNSYKHPSFYGMYYCIEGLH